MAFRLIPKKKRKAAIKKCIESIDVNYIEQVANEYEMDARTLRDDCHDLIKESDEMIKKKSLVQKVKKVIIRKLRI
jgi:hypothetical protein